MADRAFRPQGQLQHRIALMLGRLGAPGSIAAFLLLRSGGRFEPSMSREDEAERAMRMQGARLVAASGLFALAVALESDVLRLAAMLAFLANLADLLPFRALPGGRLFPGFAWPAKPQGSPLRLRLSVRIDALVRAFARRAGLETADAPQPLSRLLGPALLAFILAGFVATLAVAALMEPFLIAGAILLWVAATSGAILAIAMLDRRVLDLHVKEGLAPRRPRAVTPEPVAAPKAGPRWATRTGAKAALVGYLTLCVASVIGAGVTFAGLVA